MAQPARVDVQKLTKLMLSWRFVAAAALAVGIALVGGGATAGSIVGILVFAGLVGAGLRRPSTESRRVSVDPFALGEPWRQFVQGAQRSERALGQTLSTVKPGPLRDRLVEISERLNDAVVESSTIALRGNEIDGAVKHIDPTRLRSRLATLQQQHAESNASVTDAAPSPDDLMQAASPITTAIASVESQLATADRLKALSATTADNLRLAQARLDELVARVAEVSVGAKDTDTYAANVDDLVDQLEALRLAVAETEQAT